eukprot:7510008-Alexandrium_andersonii.AAC.1
MSRRWWTCAGLSESAWACRLPESPPAYELQANGSVENAVGQLKGLIRAPMLALQERIQGGIPVDHP